MGTKGEGEKDDVLRGYAGRRQGHGGTAAAPGPSFFGVEPFQRPTRRARGLMEARVVSQRFRQICSIGRIVGLVLLKFAEEDRQNFAQNSEPIAALISSVICGTTWTVLPR